MYCKFCASPTDLKNAICENCNKGQIAKNSARLRFWGIIALLFFLMGTVVVTYDAYIKEKESSSYTTSLDGSNDPNPDLTAISDPIETVTSPAPTESYVDSISEDIPGSTVPFDSVTKYSLPGANTDSVAYSIGEQQALEWLTTGSLRQLWYSTNSTDSWEFCKTLVLGTYMGLSGGQSTPQEYADFIEGCTPVVDFWLENE